MRRSGACADCPRLDPRTRLKALDQELRSGPGTQAGPEALTTAEPRRSLLPQHLTYAQIAETLHVSVNIGQIPGPVGVPQAGCRLPAPAVAPAAQLGMPRPTVAVTPIGLLRPTPGLP